MERNLRLLKSGGRMGVVLPEWVLNNSQLQSVREYFEGRARILFIVSIPQDVFKMADATVKSSLLFLKKFTDEETLEYEKISEQATITIASKYTTEKESLITLIKSGTREEKLIAKKSLKTLEETITKEIRSTIKEAWDYEIAVAQVDKAGISTTGGVIENELVSVAREFSEYTSANHLWEKKK